MIEFIRFKRGQQQVKYTHTPPQFIGNAFLPQYALIPLSFQTQMSSQSLVSTGDVVREGQIIANAANPSSVHVHSSVPGIVSSIIDTKLPSGFIFRGIRIKTEGAFDILGKQHTPYPWRQATEEDLLHFINFAGLVNTAEGIQPLATMMRIARKNNIRTLTTVLYDRDPSCELDSFLTNHFFSEIAEGIAIAARAFGAMKVVIETVFRKKEQKLHKTIEQMLPDTELSYIAVPETYPPDTPYTRAAEKNALVIDAVTALALHESVLHNQPMLCTYVQVSGKALECSKIFKVRIGTPIGNLIEECGGFKNKHSHILINGLLQGILVDTLDLPIGKGIKSVYVASKDIKPFHQIEDCSHCGSCLRSCPAYIDPIKLVRSIYRNYYTPDILHAITLCRHCACCSAVCPARIPLCAIIKNAAQKRINHAL